MEEDDEVVVIGCSVVDMAARLIPMVIPGSKLYPCAVCGVLCYVSPRHQPKIEQDGAKVMCLDDCPTEADIIWPTSEAVLEDLAGGLLAKDGGKHGPH